MDTNELNLDNSMLETIRKSELTGDLVDLADAGIGKIMVSEHLLGNIPYVKALYGLYKGVLALRDHFLIKKILRFLVEFNQVSEQDRENMFWDLQGNEKRQQEVGEQIIILLDKADDVQKANYIGKLFKAYTERKIGNADFIELSSIVSNLIVSYIKHLPSYTQDQSGKYYSRALHAQGLVIQTSGHNNSGDVELDGFRISGHGRKLVELLEL